MSVIVMMPKQDAIQRLIAHYNNQKGQCLNISADEEVDQILLIRHGEPAIDNDGWYNRDRAEEYMAMYDRVGVKQFYKNPICTDNLDSIPIYHSTIPRARHTAELLFFDHPQLIADARFREFERKRAPFFNWSLPIKFWTRLSRLLWYLGVNVNGIESLREARQRCAENARFLADQAKKNHITIVVAHGFHNRYVSKYLQQSGWTLVRKAGHGYWGINILAKT